MRDESFFFEEDTQAMPMGGMEMGGMPEQMTSNDFLSAFIAKLKGEGPTTYKKPNTNARDRERARRRERRQIRKRRDSYGASRSYARRGNF